ncbi:MAG TPA: Gfo/Idh/MocA family oxidoreductase [Bryobacteraceae bacterium]|nr:Gfo/Idh/MocA family oxidoreductase [Bryobacteraceae bacterium]
MLSEPEKSSRREFIGHTAGTAAGLLILKPHTVRGYQANSAVRIGLLGCGARGTAVATSFSKNTTARIVALADIFPDQLEKALGTFGTLANSLGYSGPDRKLTFRGAHAYQELAASNQIDAIQISTPPFFHVEHLDAAVAGGKHAYCEKPVGVDIAQTQRALQIAARVDGKVSIDVGFQIRSAPPFVELVRRIHGGALGKLVSISAHYYAPAIQYPDRPASMSHDELRLRNWNWDLTLSGDIIVEQDIHVIDICNWVLQSRPLNVYATGARSVLTHFGNNFDNYQVNYTYPNDIHVSFAAKQYGPDRFFDVSEQVFGAKGYSESPYSGPLRIVGDDPWEWKAEAPTTPGGAQFAANGVFSDNLAQADSEKDKGFIESIVTGKFHNQISLGVESARSAMMARISARQKRVVSWDDLMASNETFDLGFDVNQFV